MSNKNSEKFQKIRIFWEKYEKRVVLIIGLFLVAIISFEVGILEGHKIEQKTLVIEKATEISPGELKTENSAVLGVQSVGQKASAVSQVTDSNTQECLFVGSKNSTKYHKPDCRWAKNIKPENLVCFKSEEEARNKGYVGDKNCVK